jgi:hypothetical protein
VEGAPVAAVVDPVGAQAATVKAAAIASEIAARDGTPCIAVPASFLYQAQAEAVASLVSGGEHRNGSRQRLVGPSRLALATLA